MGTPRADCPTPRKMRFTTRSAAKKSASYRSRSVGFPLYTYKCGCGSWHMTRQRQETLETPEVHLHGVGHALGLPDDQFMNVVIGDVTNELAPDDGQFLRHADVLSRWRETLILVRQRAEREVASLRKLRDPSAEDDEWRTLLLEHIEVIGARQRECAELRTRVDVAASARPRTPSQAITPTYTTPERIELRDVQREHVSEQRLRRRTAGDRALEVFVNRYRREFNEIFNAEAERVGLNLRFSLDGHALSDEDIRRLRVLESPAQLNGERPPRLPDAHLAITGDESFDEVLALLIGTVYRHLRERENGAVAARAVRDIVLQAERYRGEHRNVRAIAYIAHDWVTLHV